MKCFGIEKCATWEGIDVIKYILPNGSVLYTLLPHSAFVCCGENLTSPELKANMKIPSKQRGTSQTRNQTKTTNENASILNEIAEIKLKLNQINDSTEKNSTELDNIKTIVNENNVLGQSLHKKLNEGGTAFQSVPTTPNLVRIARENRRIATPKRKSGADNYPKKLIDNLPKPVQGTRDINIGPPPAAKPSAVTKPKNDKPKFEKSVWISKLDPSVSNEMMSEFILTHTDLTDKSQFNVHKLVKKDADITELSYVSFKIDVNEQHFDALMNPDTWPKYVAVREFIQIKPVQLGEFIDEAQSSNKQRKIDPKNDNEHQMDIQLET